MGSLRHLDLETQRRLRSKQRRRGGRPLRDHVGGAEGENVDGREAGLPARRDEHDGRLGGRVLHDGVVHRLGHGQQAGLSVTHVEALRAAEVKEKHVRHLRGRDSESRSPVPAHGPGCEAPAGRAARWGGS